MRKLKPRELKYKPKFPQIVNKEPELESVSVPSLGFLIYLTINHSMKEEDGKDALGRWR